MEETTKEPIKIELTTEDEQEVFKWVWQNFNMFNQARKIRPGKVVLDIDKSGKIKTKFEISGDCNIFLQ